MSKMSRTNQRSTQKNRTELEQQQPYQQQQSKLPSATANYSDEDYEEGFDAAEETGVDEMERIRKAMAKENQKTKAHAFNNLNPS